MSNSSLSLSDANMEISIGIKCPYRAASQEAVRHVRFLCSQDKIRSWIRKKYSKSDPIPVQHFFFYRIVGRSPLDWYIPKGCYAQIVFAFLQDV